MAHATTTAQPYRALRKAAFAAVAALGLAAAAPTSRAIDARLVHPAIGRHFDYDVNDDRLADAQRRVDEAQRRVDEANANLQRVRGPALDEMEDSPEFQRATRNADAAEDRLNDEISRVLDRLSQDNPDYRRARARRVASDYIPELRESDDRAAKVEDRIHALERDALDRDRRVSDARADAIDANNAIDALLARYEDRLRDRPAIADAMDRLQAEQRALADANAELQDVQGRLAGGPGVDEDRYTPPPREVVDTYERDLGQSGRWVDVPNYGRCFVPNGVDANWRPYTNGHWSHGDDGWAWVADDSEASWGEICYHYGRWTHVDRVGWCWVPGTVWAPAWVAWRSGGDYCGWAPLPPEGGVEVSVAIVDRIPPTYFNFCEEKYLGAPRLRERIVPADRTTTIIHQTVNITNVTVVNNRVVNRGVDVARVERLSGHRVERTQVATASTPTEARRLRSEGKVVRYEPPVVQKAAEERIAQHERVARRAAAEKPAARTGGATPANTAADRAATAAAARRDETPGARTPAHNNEATGNVAKPNAPSATADRTTERKRAMERHRAARSGTAAKPTDGATPSAASANNAERRQTATTRPATPESGTAARTERERAAARERTAAGTPGASGQPTTPARATPDRATERERATSDNAATARQDRTTAAERERAARTSDTAAAPTDSDRSSRSRTATTAPSRESTDTAGRDRSSTPAERDRGARPAGAVIPPSTDRPSERDRSAEPGRSRDTAAPAGSSSSRDRSPEATPTPPTEGSRNSARDRATERDRSTRTPTTAPSSAGEPAATSAHDRAVARERARQNDSTDKNR
jgi:hypothetical protein